jgi:hypothetical protein
MNSKKAITLLVLTTLLLTLVPLVPVQAISVTDVYDLVDGMPGVPTYTGVYEDTLVVVGSGVTAGKTVNVYWDAVDAWDGESGLLNGTKAEASGAFELWFDIPEALNGDHYLWLQDTNTGDTIVFGTPIDVTPYIDVDPSSGLPGDDITLYGYGYESEEDIDITWTLSGSPPSPESDEMGSWSVSFEVPDDSKATYTITGTDETLNAYTADFDISAAITLDIDVGEAGTLVRVTGRGFTPNGLITSIVIDNGVDPATLVDMEDPDDDGISTLGKFTTDIIIPSVVDVDDDYEIIVTDSGALEGRADFEVTGLPEISADPEYGVQGSTVAVEGYNWTKIADEDVTLYLRPVDDAGNPTGPDYEVEDFETDRNGEISGTFKIPAVASGSYRLYAEMEDWNLYTDDTDNLDLAGFKVGLMIVIISPDDGPVGEFVSLTASGFEPNGDYNYNITGNGELVEMDSGDVESDGSIATDFTVPLLPVGVYSIDVRDEDNGITVSTEFEITDVPIVELSPMVAPSGYNVTIEGWYFSQDPTESGLSFLLYNDTDEWDLEVLTSVGGVLDDTEIGMDDDWDDGYFMGWFEVPNEDNDEGNEFDIDIGTYMLNITDGADIVYQYVFDVVTKVVEIEPRKTSFRIGETVSFDVYSTFKQEESYIEIFTPGGDLYWKTEPFWSGNWIEVGTEQVYPSFSQIAEGNLMTLLEDAPVGTWEWTWYDEDDEELDSGTFEVEPSSADVLGEQVTDLNNKITDLSSQVESVSSEFDDVRSDIADVAAIAEQAVAAANQAAEAVQTVAETANQANTAAENAATAAEAARDAANGLTTLVYGAIGAALVAALAAIVSLMQISRRIAG